MTTRDWVEIILALTMPVGLIAVWKVRQSRHLLRVFWAISSQELATLIRTEVRSD